MRRPGRRNAEGRLDGRAQTRGQRSYPHCRCTTDDGVVGYGSVFTTTLLVEAALRVLEPLYRGEQPLEPERVSEKLAQNSFWMGMGGTLTHAISGIDIALWDILGKVTAQPVGRLLGGRCRERGAPIARC